MAALPWTTMTARRRRIIAAVAAVMGVAAIALAARHSTTRHRPEVAAPTHLSNARPTHDALTVAVSDATVLARVFAVPAPHARTTIAALASNAYRADLVDAVDRELVPLQAQAAALPGRTVFRQAVLATRPIADDGRRARVAVWMLIVVGQSGQQANPEASFAMVTEDLVVEGGDWKLDHVTQAAGPTPLLAAQPDAVESFDAALAGFTDWRPR